MLYEEDGTRRTGLWIVRWNAAPLIGSGKEQVRFTSLEQQRLFFEGEVRQPPQDPARSVRREDDVTLRGPPTSCCVAAGRRRETR